MVLEEMEATRVNPYRSGQGEPPVHLTWFPPPPASGGHPMPGGDLKSASCSVDDVHQARVTQGRVFGDGRGGGDVWRGQKRDRGLLKS